MSRDNEAEIFFCIGAAILGSSAYNKKHRFLLTLIDFPAMSIRFTLRQLSVFVAVARLGSTRGAGEALAMSQSAASAALGELEAAVNELLFDRHGRKLMLNDAGRALLSRAAPLVESAESLSRTFESSTLSLRIAASSTIGNYVLPAILVRFLAEHPTAKLDVSIQNTQGVLDAVSGFNADIGLMEGSSHDPDVVVQPWMDDEMVVVAAPHSPVVRCARRRNDLASADWIVREPGSGTREFVEQQIGHTLGALNIAFELGDSEAIRRTLIAGYGISCLSRHVVAEDLEAGRLVEINDKLPPLRRPLMILTHRNKAASRGLAAFRNILEFHADVSTA
jgi:DNA-binding transcriptional LysR family regulator